MFTNCEYIGLDIAPDDFVDVVCPGNEFDAKMNTLAASFVKNFAQYAEYANEEILNAAPKVAVNALQ